jgi:hypothetical protein
MTESRAERVRRARELRRAGGSCAEIGEALHLSASCVAKCVRGVLSVATLQCAWCPRTFEYERTGKGSVPLYCSPACRKYAKAARARPHTSSAVEST